MYGNFKNKKSFQSFNSFLTYLTLASNMLKAYFCAMQNQDTICALSNAGTKPKGITAA